MSKLFSEKITEWTISEQGNEWLNEWVSIYIGETDNKWVSEFIEWIVGKVS